MNTVKCGSEPARDSGVSVSVSVECYTAIASRLAPTGGCVVSGNTNPGTRAGVCGVPLQPYTSAAIAALKVLLGRMALLVSSGLAK
ncbi:hypothetical protein CRX69_15335 [Pseudomonas rhizophila]|uniref:Uncharacterized protein n=1 Tax=Pseudomonas rhizophila TaxID=2045200 RepID=A0ABM6UG70_9PSED|nr:hypothetical protein CRX69_15335 [Pseudomonas rhizophila]